MKENAYKPSDWLPTSVKEVRARGWDTLDVILFTGDAYVDHPSFGPAVVGRLLEAEGLRVAIVPQPNWRDDLRDFRKLGRPRLFFGVSAGNMDSMVNHYTANKRLRSDDAYTAGGQAGFRPDYAATVYTRILKRLFPDTPVVLGGIEASLRRLTHYDYWSDSLKPSILIDSGADLLAYGMGDRVMPEIARAARNGFNMHLLKKLPQVAFVADRKYADSLGDEPLRLYPFERCLKDKRAFGENFRRIETESNRMEARTLVEETEGRFVVVNPPYPKLSEQELDRSFALPYTRLPHPRYNGKGDIPAVSEGAVSVRFRPIRASSCRAAASGPSWTRSARSPSCPDSRATCPIWAARRPTCTGWEDATRRSAGGAAARPACFPPPAATCATTTVR